MFPAGWTATPPYALTPVGPQVGYVPRVRRRIPVYAAAGVLPPVGTLPVLALFPKAAAQEAPGVALLHGGAVAYAASSDRRDKQVQDVLARALAASGAAPLLTWDAACWEEDLYRFRAPEAGEDAASLQLARLPVYCLRSALEVLEVDALSITHAAALCGVPEPGQGALALALTLATLRDWVGSRPDAATTLAPGGGERSALPPR